MARGVVQDLMAALLPVLCPGCGLRAEPVCGPCAAAMRCPRPSPPPVGVDAWAAAFEYEGVARELVARLKYRNARAAAPWLADAAAAAARQRFYAAVPGELPDIVTWPPTTSARRRERGFDHAELLARHVGRRLGLPVRGVLRRVDALPQTGRPASDRRVGPRFVERRSCEGMRVLVVDDVATTGSTLAACARALRRGGAVAVLAVTVARTPLRG